MIDTHVHLYDTSVNAYNFLQIPSLQLTALYGNYSSLPTSVLPNDCPEEFVAVEFGADDPVEEAKWLATMSPSVVAKVDLTHPETVDAYAEIPEVKVVRQHLLFHPVNKLKSTVDSPLLMRNPLWQSTFQSLDYTLELRIYSIHLHEVIRIAEKFPSKKIIVSHMGWPLEGLAPWLTTMRALSKCENVAIKVCGLEAVFTIYWLPDQITPWIESLLDLFSPSRVMFGSNTPLCSLAAYVKTPLKTYQTMVPTELHEQVFIKTPKNWYGI